MALILTKAGKAAYAQAEATGVKLLATHMAVGDGGGSAVSPTSAWEALTHETWRGALQSITVAASGEVEFTAHVPITVGGWYIREVGLYAGDSLLAVAAHPEVWKPDPDAPDKVELVVTAPLAFADTDNISLTVDTTKVLASQEHVALAIETHNADAGAHAGLLGEYAAKDHTHAIGEVNGLQAALDALGTRVETDFLAASAWSVSDDSAISSAQVETPSNGQVYPVMDLPVDADTALHISYPMPEAWDRGTVKAKVLWLAEDGEAVGNELTLTLAAGAVAPGDSLDVAPGAAVTLSDVVLGDGLLHVSDASAALTVGGEHALGDLLHIVLTRDVDGGTTNMTGAARIVGLLIQYTCNRSVTAW